MLFKRAAVRLSAAAPEAFYVAQYGDGVTASRVAATVEVRPEGLLVKPADAAAMLWPYADLRTAEPIRARSLDAVLTSKNGQRASLFIDDTMLLAQLLRRAPQVQLGAERWRTARPGLAVGASALAAYAGVWAFDLSPTKGLASTMPVKARVVLGDSVLRTMPAQARCTAADGRVALGKMVQRLMPTGPITAENIVVLDWSMLNAFAVPGNRIVLTRAMIEQAQGPDEIAAIIGHEAGHAIELHPEASLVRSVGFWALVQMVFTGTPGAIGNIGVVLAQLGYTRSAEREADAHALRLLREAKISPKPMGDFFRRMDKRASTPKAQETGVSSDILASHPSNPERIARIEAQAAYEATPSLGDADWKALKAICSNANTVAPPVPKLGAPRAGTAETASRPAPADVAKAAADIKAKADAEKIEVAREAARAEAARQEIARNTAERARVAKDEADKAAAAKVEAARIDASKEAAKATAAMKLEAAKQEAAQAEALRNIQAKTAAERAAAERVEAARSEADKAQVSRGATAGASEQAAVKSEADEKTRTQIALATEVPIAPVAAPISRAATPPLTSVDGRIEAASKKIALNAADSQALSERGQAYAAKADIVSAIADFSRALAVKPTDANTLFWRASMHAQQGMLDQAVTDYSDVIRLQPKNFAAYNNRGSLYRTQKKLDLALRDYSAAIAIDGKQAIALTNRALIHRERSNLDAAIADLNAAIVANPSYANAYVRRGETLELKSARDAAITDYRAVLRFPEPAGGTSEPHKSARARLTALGVKF